jgi:hypothetical protein
MTSNLRFDRVDPSPSRIAAGTVAVSLAAALLTGLLVFVQNTPRSAPKEAQASAPRSEAPPPLDANVDWSRVERVRAPAGDTVTAYEP